MSYASLRQERSLLRMNQPGRQTEYRPRPLVPLVPGWVRRWWGLFLVPAVPALIAIRHVGHVYGTAKAWTLLGTRRDQGGDITATSPEGAEVVVQCKRRKTSLGPNVIRELLGTITSGVHKRRAGMVMTNARVTKGAHEYARRNRITVVDRPALQAGMNLVIMRLERRRVRGMHPVTLVSAAVLCAAVTAIGMVADQIAAHPHPASPAPPSSSAVPTRNSPPAALGPGSVVRAYFAAISRHDWRDVWRLGGRNVGHGPSATYNGMVSGYRLTAKDVVTSLSVTGDSVTVHIRAYETTGAVQTYSFRYAVQNGVVVSGHQVPVGASRS